jgi:hypothetical protein
MPKCVIGKQHKIPDYLLCLDFSNITGCRLAAKLLGRVQVPKLAVKPLG